VRERRQVEIPNDAGKVRLLGFRRSGIGWCKGAFKLILQPICFREGRSPPEHGRNRRSFRGLGIGKSERTRLDHQVFIVVRPRDGGERGGTIRSLNVPPKLGGRTSTACATGKP